ncbi:TMEM175 family protein [Kribbella sp. NPDC004875]|uniref:TMEM175 family protein n=1 Tax=Kribbella sp. NPDC004875 TaxID=3364107 RepID=UPI0036A743E4
MVDVGTSYNQLSGRDAERLRTLADGVFAVAMTLLVLDVRLPEGTEASSNGALWHQLQALGPEFAAYLLSFTMLGTFWLAEHTLLNVCDRSDRMLAWSVLTFLFFVSTLPFSASVLSSHVHLPLAVGVYWLNLLGLGLTLGWQVVHVVRAGLAERTESVVLIRRRLVVAQTLYALAAAISLLSPPASIIALAAVQLFFIVSPRLPFRF